MTHAERSNPHAGEPIGTVRQMYDGALTPDLAVSTFRNIDRLFPTRKVERGPRIHPLPTAARRLGGVSFDSRGRCWDLVDYLAVNRVAGLLVLHRGEIALETYQYGNSERTRWMSMSIAKSITSTLVGAALQQGRIASLEDPVTRYVPRLAGTAYEGVSVLDVLRMCSGVAWNETYTDPASDRRRLLDTQISQRPGALLDLMAGLPRIAAPGTLNNYSTGETQIAGEILRGAVRRPLAEYLSDRIWKKFGMEASARWWLASPGGIEIGGSGLSLNLRDLGRFGQFVLSDGIVGGEAILPRGWFDRAGAAQRLASGSVIEYGYSWWPVVAAPGVHEGQGVFRAIGIFGQYLYINRSRQLVIAAWGARSKPTGLDIIDDLDFCAAVAAALC